MIDAVDVLFVDEAGQMSLANVIAVARSTNSLVLLGDPQQLDQPLQGSHPPGADRSALGPRARRPGDDARGPGPVPRDDLAAPSRSVRVHLGGVLRGPARAGSASRHAAVASRTRSSTGPVRAGSSVERGRGQRLAARGASGRHARPFDRRGRTTWTDEEGTTRPLGWEDVLIVAPYNAQVGEIKRRLPPAARVGTVDKFQGQEAPISIYSMTTSSPSSRRAGWTSSTAGTG
jgi:uncharacterized protein